MKFIKKISMLLCMMFVVISCTNKPSLQKYYVENQENQDFMVLDIPTSMVALEELKLTEKQRKAYKSVEKLNFLGFKKTENNSTAYEAEREKVKAILADESYQTLIKFGSGKQGAVVKYLGTDTAIDEVVVYGNDTEKGFGIIRVLGNDMNPESMITLVEAMRTAKVEDSQLKEIFNFFK